MGLPLLVIPAGTFNHFAADLGLRSVDDTLTSLRAGKAVMVDVGVAGHRSFINTSSTGVYVDLVHARQNLEGAVGRRLAVLIALVQVLRPRPAHEPSWTGVIADCGCTSRAIAGTSRQGPRPPTAPTSPTDTSTSAWSTRGGLARSRLIAAVLTGTLGRCRVYHAWQARSVDISSAHGTPIWLSVDGEVATAESAFTQGKRPHGLLVYRSGDHR